MHRSTAPRGYVLMVVVVLGLVLASLAAILLYATGRDRAEGKQQQSSIRSVYCSEAAVAVGIEHLRELLEVESTPSPAELNDVEARTIATLGSAMASATFPVLSVKYFDPVQNIGSDTPLTPTNQLQAIASGVNKGLLAQQTPIQVLATCRVDNASSSVADAIRVDLIPIFQFAVFFDSDLETYQPQAMSFNGRVHTNGRLWLSNRASNTVDFLSAVTSARRIVSRSAFATSVPQLANQTRARNAANNLVGVPLTLNEGNTDTVQKAAIENIFPQYLLGGRVGDSSNGAQPLTLPIKSSTAASCANDGACGVGRACMKVRATDSLGLCTDTIVSRPSQCNTAGSIAEFGQSLAIELIRRPAAGYENSGVNAPYNDGDNVFSDIYTADFGPRPAIDDLVREYDDLFQVTLPRSVPHVRATVGLDDQGAALDRLYWKADVRIIDGVWYRKGSNEPVFDPELANYTATPPSVTDTNHLFGRVLRYAWWWDARENRVYCRTGDKNCVTDGNVFQRGQQIRATDFDVHAFMVLLENGPARSLLFPGGVIPDTGITLYMSETYDPTFEDANSKLPRAAGVRNFLNFPYMHNHLIPTEITTPAAGQPARIAPAKTATGPTVLNAPSPYQLGFYPENLWGRNAPAAFRSLTPALTSAGVEAANNNDRLLAYLTPNTTATPGGMGCQPTSALPAARIPGSRPASFSAITTLAPCIQAGATPLGAENAVRLVRAQSLPDLGFTFVTDNRLYVHGDVNVSGTGNAVTRQDIPGKFALIADSITLLSEKFDERTRQGGRFEGFFKPPTDPTLLSAFSSTNVTPWVLATNTNNGDAPDMCSVGNTTAFQTRVNASLMAGNVPSCVDGGNSNGNRSGGINNFPRLAENWTNIPHVITGSLVSPYLSERGNSRFIETGFGSTAFATTRSNSAYNTNEGCTHTDPLRTWQLDTALTTGLAQLPPSTPRVVATERLRWVRR